MERCFTARELVITSSRLQWNAASVTWQVSRRSRVSRRGYGVRRISRRHRQRAGERGAVCEHVSTGAVRTRRRRAQLRRTHVPDNRTGMYSTACLEGKGGKLSRLFCAILCATIVHSALHTHMNRPNSSLNWVLSHWAHFTVHRFILCMYCVHV